MYNEGLLSQAWPQKKSGLLYVFHSFYLHNKPLAMKYKWLKINQYSLKMTVLAALKFADQKNQISK